MAFGENEADDKGYAAGFDVADDISDDALDTLAGGQDSTALAARAGHEPPGPAF